MKVIHELKIQLLENGDLSVTGPLNDKILVYGMLESVKDIVREQVAKEAERRIKIAQPHPLINPH